MPGGSTGLNVMEINWPHIKPVYRCPITDTRIVTGRHLTSVKSTCVVFMAATNWKRRPSCIWWRQERPCQSISSARPPAS